MKNYQTARGHANKVFHIDDIRFEAVPNVPALLIMDFATLSGGAEDIPSSVAVKAIKEFFQVALIPASHARFEALLRDPDHPVDIQMLVEIAGDLVAEYSAERPTGDSSSTTSPTTESGPNSMAGSLPKAVTFSRPEPVSR